jgi:hypothetical protein
MAEAASDREVRVGQGELRGLLQIKVRGSCDQGADCCRRNKAPDPERPGGDEAWNGILKLIEAGKDPERTKAFLNAFRLHVNHHYALL